VLVEPGSVRVGGGTGVADGRIESPTAVRASSAVSGLVAAGIVSAALEVLAVSDGFESDEPAVER
jgi:hypothetical protein